MHQPLGLDPGRGRPALPRAGREAGPQVRRVRAEGGRPAASARLLSAQGYHARPAHLQVDCQSCSNNELPKYF